MIKVVNQEWYTSLEEKYKGIEVPDLPLPVSGVPMSAEDYDYKTFYTRKCNRYRIEGSGKEGKVYLISDNGSQVKIGISTDVPNRLRTLALSSGRELSLLTTYSPNIIKYSTMERLLHDHYDKFRTLGEWFKMEITEEDFLKVCSKLDSGMPR